VKTLEINQHLLNAYLEGVVAKHLEVCAYCVLTNSPGMVTNALVV
jgi:hypothetical protein